MKTIYTSILTAVLMLGLIVNPAAAAGLSGKRAAECGTTYIVKSHDNLTKIASYCGTTVATILGKNPQLTDPNVIYPGQVLSLSGVMPVTASTAGYPNSAYNGSARVSISTTQAASGSAVTVLISGFPANSWIDYRVGQLNYSYSRVYDGTVEPDGTDSITITLPSTADYGEYWVVFVTTTSQKEGVAVTSLPIFITG